MDKSKRRFWRPRFSLWALLVLITIIAIPLGYVAQRRGWNLRRKAAWEVLQSKRFEFDDSWVVSNARLVSPPDDPFGPGVPVRWTFEGGWNDLCLENSAPRIKEFYAFTSYHHGLIDCDEDIAGLAAFPEIEGVSIAAETDLTDQGLSVLQGFRKLRYLSIGSFPKLTGDFFRHLKATEKLETLQLSYLPNLDGTLLCQLSDFQNLRDLEIKRCEFVTDESLRQINLPPSLKKLKIESNSISDDTLLRWLSQVQLTALTLRAPFTRKLASALSRQHELESLEIFDGPFVDQDFLFLEHCNKLKVLKLEVMPIRADFLGRLSAPNVLEELSLRCTLLNDENLPAIARYRNLSSLDLAWTPITGEGFEGAEEWPKTAQVSLLGTQISERGKAALLKLRGVGCFPLPANWMPEDFDLANDQPEYLINREDADTQVVGGPGPWDSPLWNRNPRNCSAEDLAPVLRLHGLMREKLKRDKLKREQVIPEEM